MRDLVDAIMLLAASQGAALTAVLAVRRKDRFANRILAALVGALSSMLALGVVDSRWGFGGHPHLIALGMPLPFLLAPLLYLYVVALTRPVDRFDRRWVVHALPFLAELAYLVPAFYTKSGPEKLALAQALLAGSIPLPLRVFRFALVVQALCYLLASWLELSRYRRKVSGYFSDVARIELRWLSAMVVAHAAVWTIVIASRSLEVLGFHPAQLAAFERSIQLGSALVVFLTGYVSLWQPELFQKAQAARAAETQRPLPRYQRNRLDDDEAARLARAIVERMTAGRLYRDSALTLPVLAESVGATPHMVSQVLNLHIRKSFFALVNSYRAEELKRALADPKNSRRGVLELALEAGFNSKSALNSFFKRHTGLTPTEFRALHGSAGSAAISRT